MQIQSINSFSNIQKNQNPQFKSVYPVIHWLAETNGSFAPQITKEVAQEFNENIIRRLNMKKPEIEQKISELIKKIGEITEKIKTTRSEREKVAKEKKIEKYRSDLADLYLTKRVQKYILGLDPDYAKKHVARNFYNKNGYENRYGHEAAVYIVTGDDALELDLLGREIGMARAQGNIKAIKKATSKYWTKGSELVAAKSKEFVMPSGEEAELHVKVETLRDRDGEKKSYNILDMKCFPKEGPNNPFTMINWIKS